MISTPIVALLGLVIGGLLSWLSARALLREARARLADAEKRLAETETQLQRARDRYSSSVVEIAKLNERLDAEARLAREKLALLENARADLSEALKTLSRSLPEPTPADAATHRAGDHPAGAADSPASDAPERPPQPASGKRPSST